jgi:hypothetical protein
VGEFVLPLIRPVNGGVSEWIDRGVIDMYLTKSWIYVMVINLSFNLPATPDYI